MKNQQVSVQLTEEDILKYNKYVLMMCKSYRNTALYKAVLLAYSNCIDVKNLIFTGTEQEIKAIFGRNLEENTESEFVVKR